MKKLKIIQFGINHEHAKGKFISCTKFLQDTFELVGVVDDTYLSSPSMPIQYDLYKNVRHLTPDEAFNYPDLDAVLVEVPNLKLVEIGMEFAKRGIPMHLDKPAGETLEPYQKLLDLCRTNNVPLQMGYMYRGNPALSFIRKLIKNGVLGEIYEVEMDMNHNYGGDEYQQYIGKFKGGIMFNLGCHLIDFVISAMGLPEHAVPFLKNTRDVQQSIKNNALTVLEYPYATVTLRANSRVANKGYIDDRRWSFIGTNGIIEVHPPERFDGKPVHLRVYLEKETEFYPAGDNIIAFPSLRDRYEPQLREFAGIVRGEISNPYTYEHDLQVHKLTLAASGYIPWQR